jgi:hypothetical protein
MYIPRIWDTSIEQIQHNLHHLYYHLPTSLQLWARPNPHYLSLKPTYERNVASTCRKILLPTLSSKGRATRNSGSSLSSALLNQETYGSISIPIKSIVHSKSLRSLFGQHLLSTLTDLHQFSLLSKLLYSTIRILATTTRISKNTDAWKIS